MQDACQLYDDATAIAEKIHCLWARLKATQLRKKYRTSIGALERIRNDLQYTTDSHREKKEEERYPYLKGDQDHDIRTLALLKARSRDEFMKRLTIIRGRW